jgi:hypothetical protein
MGAAVVFRIASAAASDNATLVAVGPVKLCFITAYNAAAAARYVKLYNKATAPTVGTDVPIMTIAIQATSQFNFNLGENQLLFPLGLGVGMVTGATDNNTTALTAADVVGLNVGYA